MGGKKKLSLKQMERTQTKKDEPKEEKKTSTATSREKKTYGILAPSAKGDNVLNELKKMKVLTPYTVASRFNIRLSVAKDLLEELRQRGAIQFVSGSRSVKIYKTPD